MSDYSKKAFDIREIANDFEMEVINSESECGHDIILSNGLLRWKERPTQFECLNSAVAHFDLNGITKNHEEYRNFYRSTGYSLRGYWEVFYWSLNNEIANKYKFGEL